MQRVKFFLMLCVVLCCIRSVQAEEEYVIKVGASPVVSSAGIFLAQEKGFFKEEGLTVEIVYFKKSGAPMTVLLSSGSLDVGGGNVSAGLWNAIHAGMDIRLVADKGHVEKVADYIGLLVRKDLVDDGSYRSFADLKGMRMGVTAFGVSQQIASERFLRTGGGVLEDVLFFAMPYSQMNVALENKDLEATVQLEPYLTKAVMDGIAVKVAGVDEVYPRQQSAAIFYAPHFIKDHPVAAQKFMVAYLKGVRAYRNAFLHNQDKDHVIALLKKHVKITDDAIWQAMVPIGLNPDGYLHIDSLRDDLAWYHAHDYVSEMPRVEDAVDHQYVAYALEQIDNYSASIE